jgi:hypothetical protein
MLDLRLDGLGVNTLQRAFFGEREDQRVDAASKAGTVVSGTSTAASAMWAGVISGLPAVWATRWAIARISATFVVGLSSMKKGYSFEKG